MTPGSAVRFTSVARHITDCATRPGKETALLSTHNIIQLMHSFEVNIKVCQPENSDVHRGKKECTNCFVI